MHAERMSQEDTKNEVLLVPAKKTAKTVSKSPEAGAGAWKRFHRTTLSKKSASPSVSGSAPQTEKDSES